MSQARATSLLPQVTDGNVGAEDRKRAIRELGDCLSDISGDVSVFAQAILQRALVDCENDPSINKFALEVLVDALEPSDYLPLLLVRLKASEKASVAALNCVASLCDEVEEEWPLIDQALSEALAEKNKELVVLRKLHTANPTEELATQIKAKASDVASLKRRIANWKDEQDWADDDDDY
jgi:hypothetical protein